jgi:glycosyltransferase involved in cell wall biosynthesis
MNGTKNPLLSVIIPTRERVQTLPFAIETALDQQSVDFEVLVSDNFSQDNTRDVVASIADPRLRYVNTGKRLSMCDSYEFGLDNARGDFVLIIGDDDAVFPGAIDRLQSFLASGSHQVFTWQMPVYYWPMDGKPAATTDLAPLQPPREIDLQKTAAFVISHGGWQHYRIPSLYHSAVSRRIPDALRQKTGRVFHTTLPDVFTSMAMPVFAAKALDIGQPVTASGHSRHSNGGANIAKQGRSVLNRYITEFGAYRFHPNLVPDAEPIVNLTGDTMLRAMEMFPEFYGKMTFDFTAMWAYMWRIAPTVQLPLTSMDLIRQRHEIRKYHPLSVPRLLYYIALHKAAGMRREFIRRLGRRNDAAKNPPDNIRDFVRQLSQSWSIPARV